MHVCDKVNTLTGTYHAPTVLSVPKRPYLGLALRAQPRLVLYRADSAPEVCADYQFHSEPKCWAKPLSTFGKPSTSI